MGVVIVSRMAVNGRRVVALVLFPNVTQLDLTGPAQVFGRWPDTELHLVAQSLDPVMTDAGFALVPTVTFEDCPAVDVLCVPGGDGVFANLENEELLGFVRRAAREATWVTSVCTGAFVLAAAGLLQGRRTATHWASRELLASLGVDVVAERVVFDGNVVTGGGVTAGIDFALSLTAAELGEDVARRLQLQFEYDPAPPFDAGSPEKADPAMVAGIREFVQASRREIVSRVAANLAR